MVCWDQQKPRVLSTKRELWFLSPSCSCLTPVPKSPAHPGSLRKLELGWSWLEGWAAAGLDSHGKACACACVGSVCSQPVVRQPPTLRGPLCWLSLPSHRPPGLPQVERSSRDLRAGEEEGCGPWQDTGVKTTRFLQCPVPAPSWAQDSGWG